MDKTDIITRREICELLGIYSSKLVDIIRYQPELKFPHHLLPAHRELTYDKTAVLAWSEANPVSEIKYVNALNNPNRIPIPRRPALETKTAIGFLSGNFDRPAQQQRHANRKSAAQKTTSQRYRVTTQEIGFIPATNHWEGLI